MTSDARGRAAAVGTAEPGTRRDQLLAIAASLFAGRGYATTTVRDIADAAGILSGSLYHHFDSKESMVEEILRAFTDELFGRYAEITGAGLDPLACFEAIVRESFAAIDSRHDAVAIFQNESGQLARSERFRFLRDRNEQFRQLWLRLLTDGVASGAFRTDLDIELIFRFIRDTVWVAAGWYRPGGELSARQVADQYLAVLTAGIARGPGG